MKIRCPHCRNPIEVVNDDPLNDIDCPSCGSSFNLLGECDTISHHSAAVETIGHFALIDRIGVGAFDFELTTVLFEERAVDLLGLEQALLELDELDPDLVRVVELRFFAGLRHSEVAELSGCSLRSAIRSWETARAWLYSRLVDSES